MNYPSKWRLNDNADIAGSKVIDNLVINFFETRSLHLRKSEKVVWRIQVSEKFITKLPLFFRSKIVNTYFAEKKIW